MEGWIKLHRKLIEWEWYNDIPTKVLFLHLLLRANHKPNKWKGIEIKEGEVLSGRKKLSIETTLSEQTIRTSLLRLQSTNELTIISTKQYSLYKINKWNDYQVSNQQLTSNLTNSQPTTNQQLTTNKKEKKEKNEKNSLEDSLRFTPPTLNECISLFSEKGFIESEAVKFWNFYESKGWMVGKNKMKSWHGAIGHWCAGKEPQIKKANKEVRYT